MVALTDDAPGPVLLPTPPSNSHKARQPRAEQEQRGGFGDGDAVSLNSRQTAKTVANEVGSEVVMVAVESCRLQTRSAIPFSLPGRRFAGSREDSGPVRHAKD